MQPRLPKYTAADLENWILAKLSTLTGAHTSPGNIWNHFITDHRPAIERMNQQEESAIQSQLFDAWYRLAMRGIVRPVGGSGEPWVATTLAESIFEHGLEHALALPDEYARQLYERAPSISDITSAYALEALRAFQNGLLLAAAITIGAAAERCVIDLGEAYWRFRDDDPAWQKFAAAPVKTKADQLADLLRRQAAAEVVSVLQLRHEAARHVEQVVIDLDTKLSAMFHIYRVTRNEAGHPTGIRPDTDLLRAQLRAFLGFAETIYTLVGFLQLAHTTRSQSAGTRTVRRAQA